MPIAMLIGLWTHRQGRSLLWLSIGSLILLYLAVYIGVYHLPIEIRAGEAASYFNPVVLWTLCLLVYCYFASTCQSGCCSNRATWLTAISCWWAWPA